MSKLSPIFSSFIASLFGVRIVRVDRFESMANAEHERDVLARDARNLRFLTDPVAIERICLLAKLLKPQRAQNVQKVRLGGPHDGGYVCLDDFSGVEAAISLGTGRDVSWDMDLAERGLIVYQYDHTVHKSPTMHANFRFSRRKVGPNADDGTETIASILDDRHLTRPVSVIMKSDIEQDEWATFAATSADVFNVFSQIICEFHDFQNVSDDKWFARAAAVLNKLNEGLAVVHVHGNNYDPLLVIGNMLFPQVLEVTYASKAKYKFHPTDEVFPGELDAPNVPTAADYGLGKFVYPT
jgi:hypothetical protein